MTLRFNKAMLTDGAKRMNKWLKKGDGYPIAVMVYIDGGAYNPDTAWYNTVAQYDADSFTMTKAQMSSTPTFVSSGSVPANQGVATVTYKKNFRR